MRMFNKVAVVGTGLIGGSIALALKEKKLCRQIIGICRHKESLAWAKKKGAVDIACLSLDAIKDADLVILATPVSSILSLAPKISRIIRKDCLVFDVGSTKAGIVSKLSVLFPLFVGTHPLAGSEKRGVSYAQAALFRDSVCIITPVKDTDRLALLKIKKLWQVLGAKVELMPPSQHDRVLGFVSHLSHVAAFSLINSVPEKFFRFSPASLKEATRVAASDSALWADIILDNRANVLKAISMLQKNLGQVKSALEKNSHSKLAAIFKEAKIRREGLK
jgi:prephenate dehydrogenase